MVTLEVLGTPAPKGSARAFYKAGMKRAVVVKDNSERQRGWEAAVRFEAQRTAPGDAPAFVDKPLAVRIEFRLARPGGHWGKGKRAGQLMPSAPAAPRGKPDIDKLARARPDRGCKVCKLLDIIGALPAAEQERVLDRLLELHANPHVVVEPPHGARVGVCAECKQLVRIDKPILGSLHLCVPR